MWHLGFREDERIRLDFIHLTDNRRREWWEMRASVDKIKTNLYTWKLQKSSSFSYFMLYFPFLFFNCKHFPLIIISLIQLFYLFIYFKCRNPRICKEKKNSSLNLWISEKKSLRKQNSTLEVFSLELFLRIYFLEFPPLPTSYNTYKILWCWVRVVIFWEKSCKFMTAKSRKIMRKKVTN